MIYRRKNRRITGALTGASKCCRSYKPALPAHFFLNFLGERENRKNGKTIRENAPVAPGPR